MSEFEMARKPMLPAAAGVPLTVAPGASPYTFTAVETGVAYVSGGTVSIVQLIRGATTISLGLLAGSYMMRNGDRLVITYVVAPAFFWVPL